MAHKRSFADANLQTMAYPNLNYHPLNAADRGALVIKAQRDFIKNLWGAPDNVLAGINDVNYLQNTDLTSIYKDRIIPVPSNQITAALLNGQAGFLSSVVSPIFETSEFNFQVKFREMNQLEYTRTAAGGIPNEQSYTETTWTDTIERVQLNAKIGMEVALDPNFGEDRWLFELAGLASNAMLTIHKNIAYSLVHIGFGNMIEMESKDIPLNLSKLLQAETMAFGLAALDQTRFLRFIRSFEKKILNMNMLILPQGGSAYISELQGESTSMVAQKMITDPVTGKWLFEFLEGPDTVKTLKFGERSIQCVELTDFAVNMKDDRREQPLRTGVTLCQYYPPDPNVKASDNCKPKCGSLDPFIFFQTKTQGDEVKVSWVEAVKSAFYYDYKTGKISDRAKEFCAYMTNVVKGNPERTPLAYLSPQSNINKQSEYDHNNPDVDLITGKETLIEMRGWRDQFVGLTYDREIDEFRIPKRVGDFHLEHLPNEWLHKAVRGVIETITGDSNINFDNMVNEYYALCNDIANTEWTNDYLRALINRNLPRMVGGVTEGGSRDLNGFRTSSIPDKKSKKFPNASRLREWMPNEFGSLDIPRREGNVRMTYPPGFDFGAGIITLSKEASDDNSEWREAGARAKRIVDFFSIIHRGIKEYMGKSDTIKKSLNAPWIHVDNPLAALLDSLRPIGSPVFLAVPATLSGDEANERLSTGGIIRFGNAGDILKATVELTKENIKTLSDTNKMVLVSNIAKFASCLNASVYDNFSKIITAFSTDPDKKTKYFTNSFSKLMSFVIDLCKYNSGKVSAGTVSTASVIANRFLEKLSVYLSKTDEDLLATSTALNDDLNNFLSLYQNKPGKSAIEKQKKELKDLIEESQSNKAIFGDNVHFSDELQELESKLNSTVNNRDLPFTYFEYVDKQNRVDAINAELNTTTISGDRRTQLTSERTALADDLTSLTVTDRVPVNRSTGRKVSADFFKTPTTYLRAPLRASAKLLDYVLSNDPILAYPADSTMFNEVPLEVIDNDTRRRSEFLTKRTMKLSSMPFNMRFQSKKDFSSSSSFNSKQNEEFSMKSKKSSSLSMNVDSFLSGKSFGAIDDDYLSSRYKPKYSSLYEDDNKDTASMMKNEFFGPWKNRLKFAKKLNPLERVLFLALIQTKNTFHVHENLAKADQKIINVMIFRPFIQHTVSSALVLEAGQNTLMTAIGHAHVMVTKEERGIFNINCGFMHGVIRKNPHNIALLPYCIPDAFNGGMKVDFMKDPKHWNYANPDKESMIALLTPVSEYIYEAPIHMANKSTFIRPDIDHAPYLRKYSAADFFQFVFTHHAVNSIENHHMERKSYGRHVHVSLVAHRGPVGYITSGKFEKKEGTGPRGEIEMNIHGAHKTWNGDGVKFPGKGDDVRLRYPV